MNKRNNRISNEPELHNKLHYVSKYEGRSVSKQILYLIRKCIREFEDAKGEIKVEIIS